MFRIFLRMTKSLYASSEIAPIRRARSILAEKLPSGPLVRKSRSTISSSWCKPAWRVFVTLVSTSDAMTMAAVRSDADSISSIAASSSSVSTNHPLVFQSPGSDMARIYHRSPITGLLGAILALWRGAINPPDSERVFRRRRHPLFDLGLLCQDVQAQCVGNPGFSPLGRGPDF